MAQARDIKNRIRGIKNIQQITRAMKMVATAKLRRAQEAMFNARPYAARIEDLIRQLALRTGAEGFPLMETREERKAQLLVVITGDKGLCGAFNNNVIRRAVKLIDEAGETKTILYLVGRKGHDYFRKRSHPIEKSVLDLFRELTYEKSEAIADEIMKCFLEGKVDEVSIISNRFRSMIVQDLTLSKLLPLAGTGPVDAATQEIDYIYEPGKEELLSELLPHMVRMKVYQALLESAASEHAARMTAMENATRNAEEMIDHLTLVMNKIRQAGITRELIEVVSSAEALK